MASYLIIKSIFNWYLPQSSCSVLSWFVPFIYHVLAFGSTFFSRLFRVVLFNLISAWYFPLDHYCRSIYTSVCSSVLSSAAFCLSFISPIVTTHPSLLSVFSANHFDHRVFPALDTTPLGSFDPVFENLDVDFAPSEL